MKTKVLTIFLVCIIFAACQCNTDTYFGEEAIAIFQTSMRNSQVLILDREKSTVFCIYIDDYTQKKYEFNGIVTHRGCFTFSQAVTTVTKNVDVDKELAKCVIINDKEYSKK